MWKLLISSDKSQSSLVPPGRGFVTVEFFQLFWEALFLGDKKFQELKCLLFKIIFMPQWYILDSFIM